MNPRFYKILETHYDGNYLFEIVESGGQTGVRCRLYLKTKDLFEDVLSKYKNTKYYEQFVKFMERRHLINVEHKFEAFSWCWPYDKFKYSIGVQKSRNKVDEKIKSKKLRIKKYAKIFEKNNVPKWLAQ